MKAFRPLEDRVLVIEAEEKTPGGLIIPDTAKEKPLEGVLAVGPDVRDESGRIIPLEVKVGDHVLFGGSAGLILKQSDILGVIETRKTAKAA